MIRAFVFDAYGTLFDVHAAIARQRARIGPDADRLSELWRAKQLEYAWNLTLRNRYDDFWTLTKRALDFALSRFPHVDRRLKASLLEAYRELDAFPDARTALAALKEKGHHYRFVFAEGARHTDANVIYQTLPDALQYVWQGYRGPEGK